MKRNRFECLSAFAALRLRRDILSVLLLAGFSAAGVADDGFVGRGTCSGCHEAATANWIGSHHDLSMQVPSDTSVLGAFDGREVTWRGVTTRFFREDRRFMIRTQGADGAYADFEVSHVFGVSPLQQYLIELPGRRLQAFSLAWDTREETEGGQRWFHLYPDEFIGVDDELHWTQPSQNWNSMCAECHSTRLRKNYDPKTRTFASTWSEIDVSCEACHGPGKTHVSWARRDAGWERHRVDKGLAVLFDERKGVSWLPDAERGSARRSQPRHADKEIEVCARCHSRRSPITSAYVHGERLLDHYLPRLLDDGLYYPDGQIRDEVFVYGSFIQSKMYHAGVTCSDCHEPHSATLRLPQNGVCLQCHQADRFNRSAHHFHDTQSEGGRCVACHMPPRNYMVIDARHDHSMRIPRPELSKGLGTPNACVGCHEEQTDSWAVEQLRRWYKDRKTGFQQFAGAIDSGQRGAPGAGSGLTAVIGNKGAPAIARSTALRLLTGYLSSGSMAVLADALRDTSPMVRSAAVVNLASAPPEVQFDLGWPLLTDPVRAVRIEAARVLAGFPTAQLPAAARATFERASAEYQSSQQVMAERPEAQLSLGNHFANNGMAAAAITAYEEASVLSPAFVPAYVNLANTYRMTGDESSAEQVLRSAIEKNPDAAVLYRSLGFSLVRQQRRDEGLAALAEAANLDAADPRNAYVYGVALNSAGQHEQAIEVLEEANQRHPNDRDILAALAAFHRDRGNATKAVRYRQILQRLNR